jgi:hypothetical protein
VVQAELAVHIKKVDDVRRWLLEAFEGGPAGTLVKYRVGNYNLLTSTTRLRISPMDYSYYHQEIRPQ